MLARELIRNLVEGVSGDLGLGALAVEVERPREKEHGDFSTNVALAAAGLLGRKPRDVAEEIAAACRAHPDARDHISAVEVAGPGFINFRLSAGWFWEKVAEILRRRGDFGRGSTGRGVRVMVEFVSANPVGPLHLGHGRWAAVGDTLARVLDAAGYDVSREFYINDTGTQMRNFADSLFARYAELCGRKTELPEDGYRGQYLVDLAQEILAEQGDILGGEFPDDVVHGQLAEWGYRRMLERIEATLLRMKVTFDVWFSERLLHAEGKVQATVAELEARGDAYHADGAVWLRTTAEGDAKDRVLVRESGEPTYLAADVAYHRDKFERGFEKLINIWGADHHGYVDRMKAAVRALGRDPADLEVIIGQLVNLFRGGEAVRMSKRTGELVTLDELLDDVGSDAARFFFLMRSTDTPLDFDLDLAKEQSQENPVYYVQYAHARIASILRTAGERGLTVPDEAEGADLMLLGGEWELELIRKLAEFEEVVEKAALGRTPHILTRYAQDLAAVFHGFYTNCRVISEEASLTAARLLLARATKIVLANTLELLGVDAPESM